MYVLLYSHLADMFILCGCTQLLAVHMCAVFNDNLSLHIMIMAMQEKV